MRAADVMIDILRDEGVRHVFGNPGSTEMPLMDALVDAKDLTYVLGLQETTAVGMADGYALVTGRPAFVNLHTAGGLGNGMGVLVASQASETPLVVTAGQQDRRHLSTDPWLSGDLVGLAKPVTKWAAEVHRAGDLGPALRRAFHIAGTPPTGPVFLSLPMDVLEEWVEAGPPPRSARPQPSVAAGVEALADRLAACDPGRVVLLVGDDVPGDAAPGLLALARASGWQVRGTQITSRAAFPTDDPAWSGTLRPDLALIRQDLADAEAVLLVGGRAFVAYPYRDARPLADSTLFCHLAADPLALGREYPADLAFVGDLGASTAALASALAGRIPAGIAEHRRTLMAAAQAERTAAARATILAEAGAAPISPDAAVLAVFDALPEDALVASEAAATFGLVQSVMRTRPGRYFFSRGGVLGCAMPAAVGASFAYDGPVVCLSGDGSAVYSPQAMWTAAHHQRHVLFVVFNNRRYDVLMRVAQSLGCRNAVAGRFLGMNLTGPAIDYGALASAFGISHRRAGSRNEIAAAIAAWATADGPALVEIPIR